MITMLSYDMTMVRSGLAIDDICQSFVFSVDDNRMLYDTVGGVRQNMSSNIKFIDIVDRNG